MKCHKCGAEVADNLTECTSCGAELRQPANAGSQPAQEAAATLGGRRPAAAEQGSDFKILWQGKYSLYDMNMIWFYTLLITAAFVALGIWMQSKGWTLGLSTSWFWGGLLAVPILVWLVQFCRVIHRMTIRYRLTPHRLYSREGLIIRQEEAMELVGIEDITWQQTVVERFLCGGVGRILIHSKDKTDPILVLRGLRDYETAFRAIDQARRKERERRGIALI